MNALTFAQTTDALAKSLQHWSEKSRAIAKGDPVALQGLDLSNGTTGLSDLFFSDGPDNFRPDLGHPLSLLNQEFLDTGTLRNSFFPQVLSSHSQVVDIGLCVRWRGRIQFLVYLVRQGDDPTLLADRVLSTADPATDRFSLGALEALPRGARLFWIARALDDHCEILDVAWETTAPVATEGRMVVVLRTFGRTRDILSLLGQFNTQGGRGTYDAFLANCFFLVLDTTPGLTTDSYAALSGMDHLNAFVFNGPNLGGGGNMSQELVLLTGALTASGVAINELLLLDDDLSISLESLARNWGTTLFRKDHAFHTLPVFMKSLPRKMWEDGGFWGRYTPGSPRGDRTALAPRLLRHNITFKGDDHLDKMARLHHAEYSTFIFLSVPFARLRDLGLPVAFFLRGDDIEYNLRHAAAGGVTVSNPNLAAWHEPAHSYAQEYMSIAHGTIINMAYGQDKPDDLTEFFLARARAHIGLSDTGGLSVYADVLTDLVACDRFLEPGFAAHYIAMLGRYKTLDAAFATLPEELVKTISAASAKQGRQTVDAPFLYMPPHGEAELDRVSLWNAHTERRTIYDPSDPDRMADLASTAARFFTALSDFTRNYDALRQHYNARMATSATPAFWQAEAARASFEVLYVQ